MKILCVSDSEIDEVVKAAEKLYKVIPYNWNAYILLLKKGVDNLVKHQNKKQYARTALSHLRLLLAGLSEKVNRNEEESDANRDLNYAIGGLQGRMVDFATKNGIRV